MKAETVHILIYPGSACTLCGLYSKDYKHWSGVVADGIIVHPFTGTATAVNPEDKALATCKRCLKSQNKKDSK